MVAVLVAALYSKTSETDCAGLKQPETALPLFLKPSPFGFAMARKMVSPAAFEVVPSNWIS